MREQVVPDLSRLAELIGSLILLLTLSVPLANAQSHYETTVFGGPSLRALVASSSMRTRLQGLPDQKPRMKKIAPIQMFARIRGVGRVAITLTEQWVDSWVSTITDDNGSMFEQQQPVWMLRGKLSTNRKKTRRIAATVFKRLNADGYSLVLSFQHKTRRRKLHYDLTANFNLDNLKLNARVTRKPDSFLRNSTCANHEEHAADPEYHTREAATDGPIRIVEVRTIVDAALYDQLGADANARVAAIINAANVFTEDELQLRYKIAGQHAFKGGSDPFSNTTSPAALIQELAFNNHPKEMFGQTDLFHFFTGRDLNGAVIGIAFLRGVCKETVNIAISQYINTAGSVLFAHETGHNLGASHDLTAGNIMGASLNGNTTTFSEISKQSINTHLQGLSTSNAWCLSNGEPSIGENPSPTPVANPTPSTPPPSSPSNLFAEIEEILQTVRLLAKRSTRERQIAMTNLTLAGSELQTAATKIELSITQEQQLTRIEQRILRLRKYPSTRSKRFITTAKKLRRYLRKLFRSRFNRAKH